MSVSTNTIQSYWESFEKDIVPAEAGDKQRAGMKMAFYAGATTVIEILMRIGEDDVSEELGALMFEGLRREAEAYAESITRTVQ